MKEIGSEFWEINDNKAKNKLEFLFIGRDQKLLASGSTAIDYVISDIKDKIKIVYMPDYCCESMIRPFLDNGYQIKYYNVDILNKKFNINENESCSIFFAMSYFGYNNFNPDKYITTFREKNVIVIEDITHRLFCKKRYCTNSNYLIASLRKWLPIYTGGIAINLTNKFSVHTENYYNDYKLVEIKKEAMKLKKDYIECKYNNKDNYLKLYNKANELIEDYKNKLIDNESINLLKTMDINDMIQKRISNVNLIEKLIKNNKKIKLLFNINKGDCPLFVPVIIENRNEIQKKLISNNIYCPIHWENFNNFSNDIYKKELSLICDQRYGKKDIELYMNKLIKIMSEQ